MDHDAASNQQWGDVPPESLLDLGIPGWRARTTIDRDGGEAHCFAMRLVPGVTDSEWHAGLRNVVAAMSVVALYDLVRAQVDLEEVLRHPPLSEIHLPSPQIYMGIYDELGLIARDQEWG